MCTFEGCLLLVGMCDFESLLPFVFELSGEAVRRLGFTREPRLDILCINRAGPPLLRLTERAEEGTHMTMIQYKSDCSQSSL